MREKNRLAALVAALAVLASGLVLAPPASHAAARKPTHPAASDVSSARDLVQAEGELRELLYRYGFSDRFIERFLEAAPLWDSARASTSIPAFAARGMTPAEQEQLLGALARFQGLSRELRPRQEPSHLGRRAALAAPPAGQIVDAFFSNDPAFDCEPFLQSVIVQPVNDPLQVEIKPAYGAASFPIDGPDFLVLSSGDPDAPDQGGDVDFFAPGCDGDNIQITFIFNFPDNGSGLPVIQSMKFDFDFFSYEFPEFVGSQFNDYVFGYLDTATPVPLGFDCEAPTAPATGCLITKDKNGNPTNVNSSFFDLCSTTPCDQPSGNPGWHDIFLSTPGDDAGRTGTLTVCTPTACTGPPKPGIHSLTLLVGDAGDGIYTSVGLFDNLRCFGDLQCTSPGVGKPPEITCLDPVVCNSAGQCQAAVACSGGVANCVDPNGKPVTMSCSPPSPYAVGDTDVTVVCDNGTDQATVTCPVKVNDCDKPTCSAPASQTFECTGSGGIPSSDPAVQAWLGSASAGDNCGVTSFSHNAPATFPSGCPPGKASSVTWTAQDAAGNSSTCSSNAVVQDSQPPALAGVPPDQVVECDAVPPPANVTASDVCEGNRPVSFSEQKVNGACPQSYTLVRTWTSSDSCGNSASDSQTIVVQDTTAPSLQGVPADQTVECDAVPPPANVTAQDNCDTDVPVTFTETRIDGPCPQSYTLVRTWTASDDCGNTTAAKQVVTVVDTTPPEIDADPVELCLWPPNHKYVCFDDVSLKVVIQDNCDPNPVLITGECLSDQCDDAPCAGHPGENGDGHTTNDCFYDPVADRLCVRSERAGTEPEGRTYTVTFTAADACGNQSQPATGMVVHVPHDQSPHADCVSPNPNQN